MNGMLIVISGPAGCGKDSILNELFKRRDEFENGLFYSVSATTRPKRNDEEDGTHYYFKTREEFEELIRQGAFIEHTEYCGNYYGTLKSTVTEALNARKNLILKIEVDGAANVRKQFDNCLSIFVLPPSIEELRRRLKGRSTEDDETIERRVKQASTEMEHANAYSYRVINDDLPKAINDTADIIKKEYMLRCSNG